MLQAIPPNVWTKLVHWNVDVYHNAGRSVIVAYGDGPITTEPDVELQIRQHPETATCGVCGSESDLHDPPPTFALAQVGTTADGKAIVRPALSKPIRMDPETGAICWCPTTP